MSHRSQNAKIHPLAVAMARAGVRPSARRRERGILIRFPVERRSGSPAPAPAEAGAADTPLIVLSPFRHIPAAATALAAGFGLVALVMRLVAG